MRNGFDAYAVEQNLLDNRDPALLEFLRGWSREVDCLEDAMPETDEELSGLTILDHPHITAAGTIVQHPMYELEGWHRPF